ncbi:hypothetical protein C1I98_31570, partial [Spongiactinospora gelatinilytica]
MHEATKGNRLPSWETTTEFVRACGADPAAYRERWERANQTVRGAGLDDATTGADALVDRPPDGAGATAKLPTAHLVVPPQVSRSPDDAPVPLPVRPGESADDVRPALPAQERPRRFRLTGRAALAVATVGAGAAVLIMIVVDPWSGPADPAPSRSESPSAAAI